MSEQRSDSKDQVYFEYHLGEHGLNETELAALAELVLGGPVFVRLRDRKVVASVKAVVIKKDSFLLHIKFLDPLLEQIVDQPKALLGRYLKTDPVEQVLNEPH